MLVTKQWLQVLMPNRQSSKQLRNKAASVALPDYKVPVKDFGFYVAYWKDIESDPTWRTLKDIQSSKPAICISTGWLVKKDKEKHVLMSDFNFLEEINLLVDEINSKGKQFIISHMNMLSNSKLTEEEELEILNFCYHTIMADDEIHYSEIKFFKNIRHRLELSDDSILLKYPHLEQFLAKDIVTESFLDRLTNQYLDAIELPKFDSIRMDSQENDNK